MISRTIPILLTSLMLTGCSYSYDLLAAVQNGRLVIVVDPRSKSQPNCARQIEVVSDSPIKGEPQPGNDKSRIRYGTFWSESVSYDEGCSNRFPLTYGAPLAGEHQADREMVTAKPLLRGVVYDVSTTTGATGYGSGRFVIHSNGRVENLPFKGPPSNAAGASTQS